MIESSPVLSAKSDDPARTARFAAALATLLRAGSAVGLDGELGAGKTTFVRGLAAELGAEEAATSPTFTLENRYPLPTGAVAPELVHVDLYRTEAGADETVRGSLLEARESGAIVVVEWARTLRELLPPVLWLEFRHARRGRALTLTPDPPGWRGLDELARRWDAVGRGESWR